MAPDRRSGREARHDIYTKKLADELAAHDRLDTERFDSVNSKLAEIHGDVKSLLATRSFTRGVWRAAVIAASLVSAAATVLIQLIKWKVSL